MNEISQRLNELSGLIESLDLIIKFMKGKNEDTAQIEKIQQDVQVELDQLVNDNPVAY